MSSAPRIAAAAIITNADDAVLMLQRDDGAAIGGGEWAIPGGKLDPGETLEECVIREIAEEVGIRIIRCRKIPVVTEDRAWGPDNAFDTHYFVVDEWTGVPIVMEPHKHAALAWVDCAWLTDAAIVPDELLPLFEPMQSLIRQGGLKKTAQNEQEGSPVTDETPDESKIIIDWHAAVTEVLRNPASHVLALHVPEAERGAGRSFTDAAQQRGIDLQDINPAYRGRGFAQGARDRRPPDELLPEVFGNGAIRIVYVTGWGSDPKAADEMLAALYPYVAKQANLRLVAMNNASPIPPIFRSAGPTEHPEGAGFRAHVAKLLKIEETAVSLIDVGAMPEPTIVEDEEPFTDKEIDFIIGKAARSTDAQKVRLVDLILSARA